jgi:crotonobetainyl-CoA:carnitine CoA-transferase CaiB-like acyl-CoA transferase
MSGDLEGVLVVSIEQAVAAPYCAMRLADAGARVIKVERPEGDFARNYDTLAKGQSAYFVWLNRGKESLCLDLKSDADKALLMRVIKDADVLIQNLKPGTMAKLGLPMEQLLADHPRLIGCSISGFGEEGPLSRLKAYDLIVQAETGLCSITGTPESAARVGVSVCDIAAGMTAHAAILQALFARERTGQGRQIEVSLFDALADWLNVPYLQHRYGNFETPRSGVNHPSLAPYGAYATQGGQQIIFSVQNQREWRQLCELVMEDAELADDPRFATNMDRLDYRAELDGLIASRFSSLTLKEASQLLEASGIAYGRLNSIEGLASHEHLRTVKVESEGGELHVIAPGAQFAGATPANPTVPEHGAHTQSIRDEFGG